MTYNVLDKPSILVGFPDGTSAELSVLDTFAQASNIRELQGGPTHVVCQLRFLEAFLIRAVKAENRPAQALSPGEQWQSLWESSELPQGLLQAYARKYHDRFDILDPTAPLMQVATLTTKAAEDGKVSIDTLLTDSSENAFFSMRRGRGLSGLAFGEAFRNILHTHSYDISGIRPAGSDSSGPDPRGKGGKVYPQGSGPAGYLGAVILQGANLRETLLLNLVLGVSPDDHFEKTDTDLPVWERPQLTAREEDRDSPYPHGQAELFTWQSRRIRLLHDAEKVNGAISCYGDRLSPENLHTVETMSAYRRSDNQRRKTGRTVYMPVRHDPSRAMWRGLSAILRTGDDSTSVKPAGNVVWITELSEAGILPDDFPLRTQFVGVEYGTQSSVITDIFEDSLDVRVALLQEQHPELSALAFELVRRADKAVHSFGQLSANLTTASGGDRDSAKAANNRAREAGYEAVDSLFRDTLKHIDQNTVPDKVRTSVTQYMRQLLIHKAERLAAAAGEQAWTGRYTKTGRINTALADAKFRAQLNAALSRPETD